MVFIYNTNFDPKTGKALGFQYYGEIKRINEEDMVSFVYDDSIIYFKSADVFIACPD